MPGRGPDVRLLVVLSHEAMNGVISFQLWQSYCQPGKFTQAFGVQSFYLGSITAWLTFSLLFLQVGGRGGHGEKLYGIFKASILNRTVRYHKAPRQTERLRSGQTFQGSRDYPPVAQGKSPRILLLPKNLTYYPRAVVSALRK